MTYLEEAADQIRQAVDPAAVPDEDVHDLFLLYAVLLFAVGESVTRRDVHNAWCAWVIAQGRTHDSVVPFDELPREIQSEDQPFVDAIKAVARARTEVLRSALG